MVVIVPLNEYDFLKRALAVYGDQEAVVSGDLRLTYKQLGERVNRWGNLMRSLGVEQGDRVAIISQNSHRMLDGFFGAPLIGAIYQPINFRLVASDFEYILNHAEAKVLIVEDGMTPAIEGVRPNLNSLRHFITWAENSDTIPDGWLDYEALLAAMPATEVVPAEI